MITGNMLVMFIVGFIIFCFYIAGLIYAIYWGHSTQREEMMNDPELRDYYNRHHNYDSEIDYDGGGNWGRYNPHADEKDDSYVKGLFGAKKRKSKKKQNVGKSTYWD